MNSACPIVELHFPVEGKTLPSDHGYFLFSAISKVMPEAHQADWLGIHTIRGRRQSPGIIGISRFAKLRIRLPAEKIPFAYALAGEALNVGGHYMRCGVPEVRALRASPKLRARTVMIKTANSDGPIEPDAFLGAVQKQLNSMEVQAQIALEVDLNDSGEERVARRTLKVKDTTLVGYTVLLAGVNADDSLKIQISGVGGRRRMGCGLFVPLRELD